MYSKLSAIFEIARFRYLGIDRGPVRTEMAQQFDSRGTGKSCDIKSEARLLQVIPDCNAWFSYSSYCVIPLGDHLMLVDEKSKDSVFKPVMLWYSMRDSFNLCSMLPNPFRPEI